MPTLHVELFAGRTVEQKRALAAALTEFVNARLPSELLALTEACVKTLGGSPEAVDVIFRDVERHDWASGGRLWSDAAPPKPPAG